MAIVDFLIIAFAIFMAIKAMNGAQQARDGAEEAVKSEVPSEPSAEEKLLTEIRDLLAAK